MTPPERLEFWTTWSCWRLALMLDFGYNKSVYVGLGPFSLCIRLGKLDD